MKAVPAPQRRDQRHAAALLAPVLRERLEAGVDTIIRGCTHFPFARRAIERLAGPTLAGRSYFGPLPTGQLHAPHLRSA